MKGNSKTIRTYVTSQDKEPFNEWLLDIKDLTVRARIRRRVDRFEQGNFGDYKSVGEGVYEARLHFGAGYRVYFGIEAGVVVILLCGGDKRTQSKDIKKAKAYWADLKDRCHE